MQEWLQWLEERAVEYGNTTGTAMYDVVRAWNAYERETMETQRERSNRETFEMEQAAKAEQQRQFEYWRKVRHEARTRAQRLLADQRMRNYSR